MTPYWPEAKKANGAAVVIFPGGGYVRLAINHEGHDIAKWFAARGIAAFVVKYRMQEYGFPAPLLDGLRAVRQLPGRLYSPLTAQTVDAALRNAPTLGILGAVIGLIHVMNNLSDPSMLGQGIPANDPLIGRTARNINNNPPKATLAVPQLPGVVGGAGQRKPARGVVGAPRGELTHRHRLLAGAGHRPAVFRSR